MADIDINTTPALRPPPGVDSNFEDPPTLMTAVVATAVVVLVLTTLFVGLRAYIKSTITRQHHAEDVLSYLAWAGFVTYTGLLVYISDYGFARHLWDLSIAHFMHILYYLNVLYCIYGPTTMAAKLSVLLQIKRIFRHDGVLRDRVWWVIMISIWANVIFYTALFFTYVFQCWPRERIWNTAVSGSCLSPTSSNLAAGTLNLISDIEALLLPFWALWHLNMPVKRKLAVFAVFGVGSIACIIGIVGLYLRVLVLRTDDFTWLLTKGALLVVSEIAVVIIVGCIPSLPRLYHHVRRETRLRSQPKQQPSDQPSNQASGGSRESRNRKINVSASLAKYLTPSVAAGGRMTTLRSRGSDEDDAIELRHNAARQGMHRGGDGGRVVGGRDEEAGSPHTEPNGDRDGSTETDIWRTTTVEHERRQSVR